MIIISAKLNKYQKHHIHSHKLKNVKKKKITQTTNQTNIERIFSFYLRWCFFFKLIFYFGLKSVFAKWRVSDMGWKKNVIQKLIFSTTSRLTEFILVLVLQPIYKWLRNLMIVYTPCNYKLFAITRHVVSWQKPYSKIDKAESRYYASSSFESSRI